MMKTTIDQMTVSFGPWHVLRLWSTPSSQQRLLRALKEMEVMIGPHLGPSGQGNIENFVQARNAALLALYREIIPLPGVKKS